MLAALKNFALDYWYKLMILISFILMLVALLVPIQAIPNIALLLMSFGGVVAGMGEWVNHPLQTRLAPGVKITSYNRRNCTGGVLAVIAGVLCFLGGVWISVYAYL